MGPPIFIGGNHAPRICSAVRARRLQWGRRFSSAEMTVRRTVNSHRPSRFNGAADFHRRKSRDLTLDHLVPDSLQWGRRFSSAEMSIIAGESDDPRKASMGPPIFIGGNGRRHIPDDGLHAASMGPPIFIGGNDIIRAQSTRTRWMLQWGRRFSSAEMRGCARST